MLIEVSIVNKAGERLERRYDAVRTLALEVLFDGISNLEMPMDRDYLLIYRTTVLAPNKSLFANSVDDHAVLVIRERAEYPL